MAWGRDRVSEAHGDIAGRVAGIAAMRARARPFCIPSFEVSSRDALSRAGFFAQVLPLKRVVDVLEMR